MEQWEQTIHYARISALSNDCLFDATFRFESEQRMNDMHYTHTFDIHNIIIIIKYT